MTEFHSPDKIPRLHDARYDGMHMDNLFDMDESTSGERIDPGTGLPYDNSTDKDEQLFLEGSERQIGRVFDLEELEQNAEEEMDEADAWLAENDMSSGKPQPRQIHRIELSDKSSSPHELV